MTAPAPAAARKGLVLLVDDDMYARASLRTVLLHLSLEVLEASQFDDALKLMDANCGEISVAVLDIKLAGRSGLDLLRALKQRDPGLEVIMVTGFETLAAAKDALRHGATDFIKKPFDLNEFSDAVRRAVLLNDKTKVAQKRERDIRALLQDMGANATEWLRIERGIVHDVRNMLCMVRSYQHHVRTVLERHQQLGPADLNGLREHVQLIGRQIDTVVSVLDRQSAVSRKSGETENTEVGALIEDLVVLMQHHPDAKDAMVDVKRSGGGPRVDCPANEVNEVLLNLFLNAVQSAPNRVRLEIEATPHASAALQIDERRGYAAIRVVANELTAPPPPLIEIVVRDDGNGLAPDVLAKIGHAQAYTTKTTGSGLGLGVVAEIVKRRKGALVIRTSQAGLMKTSGTEVAVLLPATAA